MRKVRIISALLLLSLFIGGCGKDSTENGTQSQKIDSNAEDAKEPQSVSISSIELLKDGSIEETIIEDFSKDYYNEEELKNMLLFEVAGFNKESGDKNISVDKFEQKNGILTVVIKYPSAETYTEYNTNSYSDRKLFYGTVSEAYDAGWPLDIMVKSVKNEEETLGKEELLQMGKSYILITNEIIEIKSAKKIAYIGENIELAAKNKVKTFSDSNGETKENYYILLK